MGDLSQYEYKPTESQPSPFYAIYTLLDALSKKLDWPSLADTPTQIEQKMSRLFELKSKADPMSKTMSISSLNKQISFYGLAFFFQKLIEFQCAARVCFPTTGGSTNGLIMAPLFEIGPRSDSSIDLIATATPAATRPIQIEYSLSPHSSKSPVVLQTCLESFVSALELWRKFNQHKEWMTIINKCIINSKSDLDIYKTFKLDYYECYMLTTQFADRNLNWSLLASTSPQVSLKRRISLIGFLLIQEKTSFKVSSNLIFNCSNH